MSFALIASLLIVFLAVAFSLQNASEITIHFFAWTFQGSLVIVLLTTLVLGVIISLLASLPGQMKKSRIIAQQTKELEALKQAFPASKQSRVTTKSL
ncbi:MAG: LapA family protein [Nitrospirales bacterium]